MAETVKDFLTDEEMAKLEKSSPRFVSDEDMAKMEARAAEKPDLGPTPTQLVKEGAKNVAKGAYEFATTMPKHTTQEDILQSQIFMNPTNLYGPIADFANKGWTTIKGATDYLTSLAGKPTSFGPPPGSPEWEAAQKFAGANAAASVAGEATRLIPEPITVEAGIRSAPTLAKGLAKTGGTAAATYAASHIPIPGAAFALEGLLGGGTLYQLVKGLREYGAEVTARKAGLSGDFSAGNVHGFTPEEGAGAESVIDVTPEPRKALPRGPILTGSGADTSGITVSEPETTIGRRPAGTEVEGKKVGGQAFRAYTGESKPLTQGTKVEVNPKAEIEAFEAPTTKAEAKARVAQLNSELEAEDALRLRNVHRDTPWMRRNIDRIREMNDLKKQYGL